MFGLVVMEKRFMGKNIELFLYVKFIYLLFISNLLKLKVYISVVGRY